MREELSADEHELLARLARQYYLDGRTQEQIATEFGLSRPKVQRLLERARATGVVDIHIEAPPGLNFDLESQLARAFGLTDVRVSPAPPDLDLRRELVARTAARFLATRLATDTVVAVGHGRDAGDVPRFFRPARPVSCTFASAMGGSPRVETPTNPNEICAALAERSGGRAVLLYAPAYVESADVRDRLLEQEAVAHTLQVAAAANVALVGIGGTDDGCTMVRSGCLSLDEIERLRQQGAVGDVLGNYVDEDGHLIASPHRDRLVALSIEELRAVDTVIAVASEPEKPQAILGVLRARVVDVLVVDEENARAVLALHETRPEPHVRAHLAVPARPAPGH